MSARVKIIKNPFNLNEEENLKVKKNTCVKDIDGVDENSLVYVNGKIVPKDYILKNGDVCLIRMFPSGVTTGIITGIMIGALVLTGAEAVSLVTTGKTIGQNVVAGLKKLFQPDTSGISNNTETVENLPSISGAKNQSAFGRAIPLILGRNYWTPYILGKPYNTIDGTDGEEQYYHCLYLIGYKDIEVRDVSIGLEVLSTNTENVRNGELTITSTKYPQSMPQTRSLPTNEGTTVQQDGTATRDGGSGDVHSDSGTDYTENYDHDNPNSGSDSTQNENQDHGSNDNPTEPPTDTSSHTHLELQCGANPSRTDGEVALYPVKVVQENFSTQLLNVDGTSHWFYFFSARFPYQVEIEFTFAGLLAYNDKGEKIGTSVNVSVEYSLDGGTNWSVCENMIDFTQATGNSAWYNPIPLLRPVGYYHFSNSKAKTLRYVLRQTFSKEQMANCPAKVVQYRIRRRTKDSTDTKIIDKVYISAVRTWCYDATASKSSQTLVPQAPMNTKERNKTARLGFSIKVSEDLVNDFDKINLIATSIARTWDSTNHGWSTTLSACRNPSALALHTLIGDFRDEPYRYKTGTSGGYLTADKIDLDSFGACFEECDKQKDFDPYGTHHYDNSYYCDGVIVNKTKTIDLVNRILQTARSFLVLNGKKYGVFMDKAQSYPLLNLNNNNLLSLAYSKNFDVIPDAQSVKYISALNYYQQDTIVIQPIQNPPVQLTSDSIIENVEYPYITDPYHAQSMSLYQQACRKLRPETLQAKVTGEGGLAEVGSLVTVQSDVILVGIGDGAEITELITSSGSITGIKTDGKFVVSDATKEYGVVINVVDEDGNEKLLKKKVVISAVGTYSNFTFDEAITTGLAPEEGCIVSFGIYQSEVIEELCVGKSENGDGTYDLTLVPYNEAIYSADTDMVPDFDPKTTPPSESGASINFGDPSEPVTQLEVLNIISDTKDLTPPPVPSSVSAKAYRDYIELRWSEEEHGNVKETVIELSKDGDQTTDESWVEVERRKTNTWNYYFDRTPTADGYPEASDLANYRFRMKNVSPNGIESSYCSYVTVNTNKYGTWLMPQTIRIQKEVIDRTVILTALYDQPKRGANPIELYGTVKTRVWISRKGNTDLIGNETFNDYLDVEPDTTGQGADIWYTPEFNEDVLPSSTEDTEKNYCHYENGQKATGEYVSNTYKVSHTLPLIGQNARLFDKDSQPIDMFSCDATDVTEAPVSPSVGDVIHYLGTTTETLEEGKYYRYASKIVEQTTVYYWEELLSKMVLVPTNYKYKLQMFIEESLSESNAETVVAQALCTNISDIVHSHEHYKDLYVEKLSAINANIGLISQGGMGDFANQLNYWALSTLSADDSGVAGGVKQGAFRVGGRDQYFMVTPRENDPTQFDVELRAGSISLSTDVSRDGFVTGTYIYEKAPEESFRRLHLTSTGIIVESRASLSDTSWNNKVDEAQVTIDPNSNMIITNSPKKVPSFGFQVNGDIYHFDSTATSDQAESGTNPQGIDTTGGVAVNNGEQTESYDSRNPLLSTQTSPKSLFGDVSKTISSFTGNMVFFSKAEKIVLGNDHTIATDGTVEAETIPAPLSGYNQAMKEQSTEEPTMTVGAYLGLNETQVRKGIFY